MNVRLCDTHLYIDDIKKILDLQIKYTGITIKDNSDRVAEWTNEMNNLNKEIGYEQIHAIGHYLENLSNMILNKTCVAASHVDVNLN